MTTFQQLKHVVMFKLMMNLVFKHIPPLRINFKTTVEGKEFRIIIYK